MTAGVPGSGPGGFGRKTLKQVTFRLDRSKVDELYRMLSEEGVTFQDLMSVCVDRYIVSDPRMRAIIEGWKRERSVSGQERDRGGIFSEREARDILDEIDDEAPR